MAELPIAERSYSFDAIKTNFDNLYALGGGSSSMGGISVASFGAIPDGVMTVNYGAATQTCTGTDNTVAIQAAIDYALQNKIHTVFFPDGNYKITDTLQLGWGNDYYSIALCALSNTRGPFAGMAGVSIFSTKTDRPVINCQGLRRGMIRGISLWGLNYVWIYNTRETAHSYSSLPSDWLYSPIAPIGNNPGGVQQHSPYAAITIDAYKNPQPTDHYPTVTYPSWTGLNTQYNKLESSDIIIDDLDIRGFAAGIVISPNSGSNGDFVKIKDVNVQECVYGISSGSDQSRNVEVRNVTYAATHTLISNNIFGAKLGQLGGTIDNLSGGASFQLFSLDVGLLPQIFMNCYFEAQVRIGELFDTTTFAGSLTFETCTFSFDDQVITGVMPAGLIANGSYQMAIVFRGCRFTKLTRLPNLVFGTGGQNGVDVTVEGGDFQTGSAITGASGNDAYRRALNYTAGILIGAGTPAPQYNSDTPCIHATHAAIRGRYVRATTFTLTDWPIASDLRFAPGFHRAPLTQFTETYTDLNGIPWRLTIPQQRVLDLTSMPVLPAFASDVLTFEYTAATNTIWPAHAGDILYHENTGTIFVITAIGAPDAGHGNALPITAKQMNNIHVDTNGAFTLQTCSDLTLAGNTFLVNCSIDLPQKVEFGTFASGSVNVTSVHEGDGYGGDITTYYTVGDNFVGPDWNDAFFNWPVSVGQNIATITNGSPGSMTLNTNAGVSGRFPIYPVRIS